MNRPNEPVQCAMCKHLRSKEMYHSPDMSPDDLCHSGIFWCEHTSDSMGPDGTFADYEECTSSRECYEE